MNRLLTVRRVFQVVFILGLFVIAVRPVNDPDFWWHLRTGQLILQNHAVFHTDPYSFTRHGQPWVNHEWLSEVLIYSLYSAAGWVGLIVSFGAITAATLLLVFVRSAGRPYVAAAITLWGALVAAPTWGVRPHTLSLLLGSGLLWLLDKSPSRPKLLWWAVPLTLLWANLHGEYALGIGLLVLFLLGTVADVVFGVGQWAQTKTYLKTLGAVLIACLAVVPLNPAGLKMYSYPFETLHSQAMQSYIGEWFSPNFHDASYLPLLFMILTILCALALSPPRIRPRDLLLLLVTFGAALQSVRHVGVFVLIAVPLLSQLVQSAFERRRRSLRPVVAAPRLAMTLINAAALVAFLVFAAVRVGQVIQQQPKTEAEQFPAGAVDYLIKSHPPGPLLNHYNWGGYLIWRLYPDYPVFIDGRADLYGDAFVDDFAATYYVRTDHWQRDLEQWPIRTLLLPPDSPLVSVLRAKPEWNQVYGDGLAVVMTRTPLSSVLDRQSFGKIPCSPLRGPSAHCRQSATFCRSLAT